MNKPVFVYGTLKSDIPVDYVMLDMHGWNLLERKFAAIDGNIYIIPHKNCTFPAVGKLNTGNIIHGELVYINDPLFLELLDQIESEGHMYNRITTITADGEECWVYQWYNPDDLEFRIEYGNFQYVTIKGDIGNGPESMLCIPMKYEDEQIVQVYVPEYNIIADL